ncbi:anti-phage ZorAB system protein ZorA [Ancylobacter amanitiformis]|uniref:ABC-type transporter Mla subunit MlaD n=1 Tax=Ancylobacter amanitiformis TaxID=217069 RepID=A0ABU0LLL6_9HYPH|nr:anti-phage ZorAB system protein ZorA [Ancylobacter amanitiformis]MDQ0509568.1 ABC-type transporter Mla subunit MlaD [Ancylobacter amanitiformis]
MRVWVGGIARFVGFWAIPVFLVLGSSLLLSFINPILIFATIADSTSGDFKGISTPEFAYALAGSLFVFAMGLGLAFLLFHIVPVLRAMRQAREQITASVAGNEDRAEIRRVFAANFETIGQTLSANWLIGDAWREFDDSLVDTDSDRAIGNTVRPHVFFNPGVARERLSGLKMMSAVPGYFVGIGLLLTFIGLVFALHKAGAAASAGDAKKMAAQMGELLQIATFKFSTSIAGLLASIVLSIVFRWFSVLLEGSFDRFNAELERRLRYHAPQSISLEIRRTMEDQLAQLKDITQGDFFARMGTEIAPRLHWAVADAMAPVTEQISHAVGNLAANSQDGVQQMLHDFTASLQHGAGTEMRELAATLKQLQMSIMDMQGGLRGTGEDFSARLGEAADNLNRMVERAGQTFEHSSGQSRDALASVVESLRKTLEKANAEVDSALGQAAGGASAKLEAAMGLVMEKLDRQISQMGDNVGDMQRAMGEQGEQTRRQIDASVHHSAEVQKLVLTDLHAAAQGLSERLRTAVELALTAVGQRFGDLSVSMRAIEGALASQKVALEATSGEARKTAQAFGETASSVRAATAPLITVGTSLSGATEKLASSVGTTLEALQAAREQIATLAAGLADTNERSGAFWNNFAAKFDDVDTALGKAVEALSRSTADQQDRLRTHVQSVDLGLSQAIEKLNPLLASMSDSAEDIAAGLKVATASRFGGSDIRAHGEAR